MVWASRVGSPGRVLDVRGVLSTLPQHSVPLPTAGTGFFLRWPVTARCSTPSDLLFAFPDTTAGSQRKISWIHGCSWPSRRSEEVTARVGGGGRLEGRGSSSGSAGRCWPSRGPGLAPRSEVPWRLSLGPVVPSPWLSVKVGQASRSSLGLLPSLCWPGLRPGLRSH